MAAFFGMSVILFASLLCSIFLIFFKRRRSSSPNTSANFTVLRSYPLIGNIPHLARNHRRLLDWSGELIPASPTLTVTVAPLVFTANPANVEHMSKTRFEIYPKYGAILSTLGDFLGRGIINTNGDEWRVQRKVASYEFNAKSLRAFVLDKVRNEITGRLLPLLTKASRSDEVLDLYDVLSRFAFDNVCNLVFDEDLKCLGGGSEEGELFFRAFDEATDLIVERAQEPLTIAWRIKKSLDVGSERRLRESMEVVHRFIDRRLRLRREQLDSSAAICGGHDFLSRLAADEGNSDEFIRDFLVNFVLGGRDTTPSALTWFFWLVSSRPDVVNKIRDETKSIRSRRREHSSIDDDVFTIDELKEMHYLHAAISESLRLYPPVPLVPRQCQEDDELPDGTRVQKGWLLIYNSYAMARTEAIWGPDCGDYKPERWLQGGTYQHRSPYVYASFHSGPRTCVGKDMAYIQMKALAASILENFEVEVAEQRGRHHLSMTLRMEGGLPVRLRERKGFY